MSIQHRLGQHYSKEQDLIKNYIDVLKNDTLDKVVIDPFCGEGHLIFFYLELFDFETQIKKLKNKQIRMMDLFKDNVVFVKNKLKRLYNLSDELLDEICYVNDSLLNVPKDEDYFVLTNPPYLAKNVCKKNYPEDFEKYFVDTKENDYFEIALNLYNEYNGIWIVPANLLSADLMQKLRKNLIHKLQDIRIFTKQTFEDTGVSVCTFYINNDLNEGKGCTKNICFVNDKEEYKTFTISNKHNLVKEWDEIKDTANSLNISHGYIDNKMNHGTNEITLIDPKYKKNTFFVSDEDLSKLENNVLILRTVDTGNKDGKLGLYTIEELWNEKAQGLITKISSRVYTQIFFDALPIEDQLKLKDDFNNTINSLRSQYNSIFLTNYKHSADGEQRKRIAFKDAFALMNHLNNA